MCECSTSASTAECRLYEILFKVGVNDNCNWVYNYSVIVIVFVIEKLWLIVIVFVIEKICGNAILIVFVIVFADVPHSMLA